MNIARIRRIKYPLYMVAFPWIETTDFDKVKPQPGETGIDRIKQLFETNECGEVNPYMSKVLNTTLYGTVIGIFLGAIASCKPAIEKFADENQGTLFVNKKDMQGRLLESIVRDQGKIFRVFGLKIGVFCFLYTFTTTCLSRYRGETYASDYAIGGTVAGGVYKFKSGPKATLVGAALGTVLGGIIAMITSAMTYVTGITLKDIDDYTESNAYRNKPEPSPIVLPEDTQEEASATEPQKTEEKNKTVETEKKEIKSEAEKETGHETQAVGMGKKS